MPFAICIQSVIGEFVPVNAVQALGMGSKIGPHALARVLTEGQVKPPMNRLRSGYGISHEIRVVQIVKSITELGMVPPEFQGPA